MALYDNDTSAVVNPDGLVGVSDGGAGRDKSADVGVCEQLTAGAAVTSSTAPTIASFINATHNHQNAAGGGQLAGASVLSEGTTGTGAFVRATSPTIATPTLSGAIPSYNSIATAGLGLPVVVASVSLTAQQAAIGTTNILTAPPAGLYWIIYYQEVTRASEVSSSTQLTINWTAAAAATGSGAAITTNTVGARSAAQIVLQIASGDLTYSTSYASSGATAMQYGLKFVVIRLQ